MAIFISYSHRDAEFVDKLAAHLIKEKAQVWLDRWELKVGDSILGRVQEALTEASALLVVLSNASVQSEWCKKELNFGLLKELEEKRVVVLPVLLEDCTIPPFLRDKKYADFRSSFEDGLEAVLIAIAAVTSETQGRDSGPEFTTDWGLDWFEDHDRFCLQATIVQQGKEVPFSVLAEIRILANAAATARYRQYAAADLDWVGRQVILENVCVLGDRLFMVLDGPQKETLRRGLLDQRTGLQYDVTIEARRLGDDSGYSTLMDAGEFLALIRDIQRQRLRKTTEEETLRLRQILSSR
jgi:hypothetical protein